MRNQLRSRVPIRRLAVVGLAAVLWTSGTAHAFYWKQWPGSRLTPPNTLTPEDPSGGGGPPGGPPSTPPPGGGPDTPEGPESPEPSTVVAGLIGLAAAGAYQWRRRLVAESA